MEQTTMLLTDFVKKLKILDKDFRATLGAAAYVEEQSRKTRSEALDEAEEEGYTLAQEQTERIDAGLDSARERIGSGTQEQERQAALQAANLAKYRLKLAEARNALRGVLHAGELGGEQGSGTGVKLADLMSGKIDLTKMAAEVNGAYRRGDLKEAKRGYARLAGTVREAERLLTDEIAAARTRLAEAAGQAKTDWQKAGEAYDGEKALNECFEAMTRRTEELVQRYREADTQLRRKLEERQDKQRERNDRIRSAFLEMYPPMEFAEEYRELCAAEPDPEDFHCAMALPEKLCLGEAAYDLTGLGLCRDTTDFLSKYYPFLFRDGGISLPCALDPAGSGNFEFQYTEKQRPRAVKQAAGLAMRLFTLIPPGQIRITFADPVTLGESFAMFPRLVDLDVGTENAIDGRIWASQADIDQRLDELIRHISDITQRCLQDRYENLTDYNRMTGSVQEGYRVLILMDYPAGMTEESLKKLERIVRFGPKCGVFTILYRSEEQMKKLPDKLRPAVNSIRTGFQRLSFTDGDIRFDGQPEWKDIRWQDKPTPARERLDDVIQTLKYGM